MSSVLSCPAAAAAAAAVDSAMALFLFPLVVDGYQGHDTSRTDVHFASPAFWPAGRVLPGPEGRAPDATVYTGQIGWHVLSLPPAWAVRRKTHHRRSAVRRAAASQQGARSKASVPRTECPHPKPLGHHTRRHHPRIPSGPVTAARAG